jgi:hypothetical protein
MGFKLNHRADDDPERFGVLAIHGRPIALMADVAAVHRGRGMSASHAWSAVASTLEVTPALDGGGGRPPEMSYTIDGDLYRSSAPTLRVTVGPRILFVRPPGKAGIALAGARPPTLLSARAGDTMEAAR